MFVGLSLLTSVQGWTLNPTERAQSAEESKDGPTQEEGRTGYGTVENAAIATAAGAAATPKPIFTVVEAKTRTGWLECVGIRVEGAHRLANNALSARLTPAIPNQSLYRRTGL